MVNLIKKFFKLVTIILVIMVLCYSIFLLTVDTTYQNFVTNELTKYNTKFTVADILSIIKVESNFFVTAVSKKGAVGLMQIMPKSAQFIYDNMSVNERINVLNNINSFNTEMDKYVANLSVINKYKITEDDLKIPYVNIILGVWYINYLEGKFNQKEEVLAGYNAGETVVKKWVDNNISYKKYPYKETRNYIKKVKRNIFHYNIKLSIINGNNN